MNNCISYNYIVDVHVYYTITMHVHIEGLNTVQHVLSESV